MDKIRKCECKSGGEKKIFSHANTWYSIKLEEDKYDMGENRMAFRSNYPQLIYMSNLNF